MMPSLEESLRLTKYSFQSGGRVLASTAYPWFCDVIWQRPSERSSACETNNESACLL